MLSSVILVICASVFVFVPVLTPLERLLYRGFFFVKRNIFGSFMFGIHTPYRLCFGLADPLYIVVGCQLYFPKKYLEWIYLVLT